MWLWLPYTALKKVGRYSYAPGERQPEQSGVRHECCCVALGAVPQRKQAFRGGSYSNPARCHLRRSRLWRALHRLASSLKSVGERAVLTVRSTLIAGPRWWAMPRVKAVPRFIAVPRVKTVPRLRAGPRVWAVPRLIAVPRLKSAHRRGVAGVRKLPTEELPCADRVNACTTS